MSGIEFKQFPTKKSRPLIVRPDRSANQRPVFFWETTCTHALTLLSEKTDFRWFHLKFEQKLTYLFFKITTPHFFHGIFLILMNNKQKRCILGPKLKYFFMTSKCSNFIYSWHIYAQNIQIISMTTSETSDILKKRKIWPRFYFGDTYVIW